VVAVVGVGIWLVLVVDGYKRCWEVDGSGGRDWNHWVVCEEMGYTCNGPQQYECP
jgi:hypothetical protein